MKRLITASLCAGLLFTPVAIAQTPTLKHQRQYRHDYHAVASKFGARAPGRNIVRWGLSNGKTATNADVIQSIAVLERFLNPPPAPAPVTPTSTAVASSATTSFSSGGSCGGNTPYSGGGQCWAIPYSIVSCESGGQNVPNTQGSGAMGYYQLMSGGTGSRVSQDAAAAALWNGGAGAGNWTCK